MILVRPRVLLETAVAHILYTIVLLDLLVFDVIVIPITPALSPGPEVTVFLK